VICRSFWADLSVGNEWHSIAVGAGLAALLLISHAIAFFTTQEPPSAKLPSKQVRRMRTSFVPGLRWIMRNSQWKIYMWATTVRLQHNLSPSPGALVPVVFGLSFRRAQMEHSR
jgi:hypothetical protein